VQLHRAKPHFEDAGVNLVLIGQASPRQAAHFRRRLEIDLPILVDESRASYKTAGAKVATMSELLGPRMLSKGMSASRQYGVRQGRTIGHPAQLGGAMLITPGGAVAWSHMSDDAGDNASPEEILTAAAGL
jgi:peroxiredoxin